MLCAVKSCYIWLYQIMSGYGR